MLLAPIVLLSVYFGLLFFIDPSTLPTSILAISIWCYIVVQYARALLRTIRNSYDDGIRFRIIFMLLIILNVMAFSLFALNFGNSALLQRTFTIVPVFFGVVWLAARHIEEIRQSPAWWNWSKIRSANLSKFAATIQGFGCLILAAGNELFIAIGNEPLWVLSCALLPLIRYWCTNLYIVRGLIKRGARYR